MGVACHERGSSSRRKTRFRADGAPLPGEVLHNRWDAFDVLQHTSLNI